MPVVSQSTWGTKSFKKRVSGLQAPGIDSSRSEKIANAAPPNLAPSVNQTNPVREEYEINPPNALGAERSREQISGSRTSLVASSPSGMMTGNTLTSLDSRSTGTHATIRGNEWHLQRLCHVLAFLWFRKAGACVFSSAPDLVRPIHLI